ncbi:hypothetical protein FACS1894189_3150 [Planctomycetales bacterium]|nr:hypothetical protein FACS1894189_3150 [Planctomycetales bacterium]
MANNIITIDLFYVDSISEEIFLSFGRMMFGENQMKWIGLTGTVVAVLFVTLSVNGVCDEAVYPQTTSNETYGTGGDPCAPSKSLVSNPFRVHHSPAPQAPANSVVSGFFAPATYKSQIPVQGTAAGEGRQIVYVPYAVPPPIYIQRYQKQKRFITTYAMPEMPAPTYTTRGPRDFLAPNPPSIGQ